MSDLAQTYRTVDDYRRYSWQSTDRRRSIASLVKAYRRYFGASVLDLCCGGGVLGRILASTGASYVGVDANRDMIREARTARDASCSRATFIAGDIARVRIPGRFDTVTLIGNSLAHFNVFDLDRVLRHVRGNVRPGSYFLIEYRDMVGMFWAGTWSRVKVETKTGSKVVHRALVLDLEHGVIAVRSRPASRKWVVDWSHAIWSPFILESSMQSHGWRLVSRAPARPKTAAARIPEHNLDVYRLETVRG